MVKHKWFRYTRTNNYRSIQTRNFSIERVRVKVAKRINNYKCAPIISFYKLIFISLTL